MTKTVQYIDFCPHCRGQQWKQQATPEVQWVLHLIIALLTCGLWLLPVAIIALCNKPGVPVCLACGKPTLPR